MNHLAAFVLRLAATALWEAAFTFEETHMRDKAYRALWLAAERYETA